VNRSEEADALARAFTERGIKAFTKEQYSRQGMLDAIRENRRRNTDTARVHFLSEAARALADDISEVVDLPASDIATVLLATSGSVGVLAELNDLRGTSVAAVLQYTADVLDRRAHGGETP
jgi:hypothetical protein